jgi:hypothetical protein
MSSLICYADESQVLVATDTLATLPDGRPFKFATKALIVPDLKFIMAGIGMFGFLNRWFLYMNEMAVVTASMPSSGKLLPPARSQENDG